MNTVTVRKGRAYSTAGEIGLLYRENYSGKGYWQATPMCGGPVLIGSRSAGVAHLLAHAAHRQGACPETGAGALHYAAAAQRVKQGENVVAHLHYAEQRGKWRAAPVCGATCGGVVYGTEGQAWAHVQAHAQHRYSGGAVRGA